VPIVRATCNDCGDVDVAAPSVQVLVCTSTGAAAYSLCCPSCRLIVSREATDQVIEALTQVGVRVRYWRLPAELAEPKSGPPITHDDLLSFHLALAEGCWQDQLAGMRPPS
jgi:hypothetical protein